MEDYLSEQEQVEALRKWWGENGKSVIAGIVLGLAAIFGWRAWQDHLRVRAEAASDVYQELLTALGNPEARKEANELAEELINDYPSMRYAVFAGLAQARLAVAADDYPKAEAHLRKALASNDDAKLQPLIRLRLAAVLTANGDHQAALKELDAKDPGTFAAAFDDLRGDIQLALGDLNAARTLYQQALEITRAEQGDTVVLEMKLESIGSAGQE